MKPAIRVEMSDFEHVWGTIQNMVLHPFENNLYHFVPLLGAFTWGHTPIVPADCGQATMFPKDLNVRFSNEVETLRKCAGLKGQIDLYTSLIFHFTSFGGRFSFTTPIIVIPYHRFFRPDGSSFCDGADQASLKENIYALTDDETKFYIAREIAHIKFGDIFIKSIARVAFLASLCFFYASPFGWGGVAAIVASLTMVLVERIHQYAIDLFAVQTLAKALNDAPRALDAAISALEKEREENKERRLYNRFCPLYITSSGNNLLDLTHPFVCSRIAELQKRQMDIS